MSQHIDHVRDEDCEVDSETDCCFACGVHHGDPCPACGGRGFHRGACPELYLEPMPAADAIADAEQLRVALGHGGWIVVVSECAARILADLASQCLHEIHKPRFAAETARWSAHTTFAAIPELRS